MPLIEAVISQLKPSLMRANVRLSLCGQSSDFITSAAVTFSTFSTRGRPSVEVWRWDTVLQRLFLCELLNYGFHSQSSMIIASERAMQTRIWSPNGKKQGYENLCCLRCIQTRDTNFGTNCICRVPKGKLEVVSCVIYSRPCTSVRCSFVFVKKLYHYFNVYYCS